MTDVPVQFRKNWVAHTYTGISESARAQQLGALVEGILIDTYQPSGHGHGTYAIVAVDDYFEELPLRFCQPLWEDEESYRDVPFGRRLVNAGRRDES